MTETTETQKFVFRGRKADIILKSELTGPYNVEYTDGDYETHYVIKAKNKPAFQKDFYELVKKHGEVAFVWYDMDFGD